MYVLRDENFVVERIWKLFRPVLFAFIRERMGGLMGGGKSSRCSPLFIFILRTATRLVTLFKGFELNVNKRPLCFRSVVGHAR